MRLSNSMRSLAMVAVIIASLASPTRSLAQEQSCEQLLTEANDLYSRGAFDETIQKLDQCLETDNLSEPQRKIAYRLKGLSFIGKGLEVDARASIKRLIELVPNYEPDPVMDPPNFVQMITEVREEINAEINQAAPPLEVVSEPEVLETPTATPATVTSNTTKRKKKNGKKWIIGGLGVAAAGGLVAVLASGGGGGGNSGGDAIAAPPALP
ncbi:MAG: hypothetical protein AB8G77_27195 [Rhodothermales bacterium]